MIDQQTIERVAAAIDSAEVGHSMRLIRLVDGVSTYRLELDGAVEEFTDTDEDEAIDLCYARIRKVKQRKQAEAVIAALTPSPQPNVAPDAAARLERILRLGRSMKWTPDGAPALQDEDTAVAVGALFQIFFQDAVDRALTTSEGTHDR